MYLAGAFFILQLSLLNKSIFNNLATCILFSSKMLGKISLPFKRCRFFYMVLPKLGLLDLNFVEDLTGWKMSVSGVFWSVFSLNVRKYGPQKLPTRKLFMQCLYFGWIYFVRYHCSRAIILLILATFSNELIIFRSCILNRRPYFFSYTFNFSSPLILHIYLRRSQ